MSYFVFHYFGITRFYKRRQKFQVASGFVSSTRCPDPTGPFCGVSRLDERMLNSKFSVSEIRRPEHHPFINSTRCDGTLDFINDRHLRMLAPFSFWFAGGVVLTIRVFFFSPSHLLLDFSSTPEIYRISGVSG